MSFFKDITYQTDNKGFFSNVTYPKDSVRAQQIFNMRIGVDKAKKDAVQASKFSTLAKETGLNLFQRFKDAGVTAGVGLFNTYKDLPNLLQQDVTSGSKDILNGRPFIGLAKSGGRVAGDIAGAIFAPIGVAVGAALQLTGGQTLQDNFGKTIADKSGITDNKAFQAFAMSHPNAGKDFERITNLLMGKFESGKIEPLRLSKDIASFTKKVVNSGTVVDGTGNIVGGGSGSGGDVQPLLLQAPKSNGMDTRKIPSGPTIELGPKRKQLLLQVYKKPESKPTTVPIYKKIRITKNTNLNKGDIVAIDGVDKWIVSDVLKSKITSRGKEQMVRLKNSSGDIFIESTRDLGGGTRIIKVGDRPISIVNKSIKEPAKQISKVEKVGPAIKKQIAIDTTTQNVVSGTKPSKVALSVRTQAIENGLVKTFDGVAGFDPLTIKGQASLVNEVIGSGVQNIKDILNTSKPLPFGLNPLSLVVWLEKEIRAGKLDPSLTIDIAQSPLTSMSSIYAQGMRILKERDPNSTTVIIQDIVNKRKGAYNKLHKVKADEAIKSEVAKARTQIKKSSSGRQGWEEFILSIKKC